MHWSYGLLQEKDKVVLIEVYFDKPYKPWAYCYASVTKNKSERKLVAEDVKGQLEKFRLWKSSDFSPNNRQTKELLRHKYKYNKKNREKNG